MATVGAAAGWERSQGWELSITTTASSNITGTLLELTVGIDSKVTKGQTLAQIDTSLYRAQAEQQRLSSQLATEQKIAAAQLALHTAETVDAIILGTTVGDTFFMFLLVLSFSAISRWVSTSPLPLPKMIASASVPQSDCASAARAARSAIREARPMKRPTCFSTPIPASVRSPGKRPISVQRAPSSAASV